MKSDQLKSSPLDKLYFVFLVFLIFNYIDLFLSSDTTATQLDLEAEIALSAKLSENQYPGLSQKHSIIIFSFKENCCLYYINH